MISFRTLDDDTRAQVVSELLPLCEGDGALEMMLDSFFCLSDEVEEIAVCAAFGCLLVRIYDEQRYAFVYPLAVSEDSLVEDALRELSLYARRYLIPLAFTDVMREELPVLEGVFSHIERHAYDESGESYFVMIQNELDLMGELPEVNREGVALGFLSDAEISEYARLCSDRELNRYWGFDDTADNPDCDPEGFYFTVMRELEDGVALSLAVRYDGGYIGEGVIYDFDYHGAAEIGLRLLPEYQGRGFGEVALLALFDMCRAIGLLAVYATVDERNAAARGLFSRHLVKVGEYDGVIRYYKIFNSLE